MTNDQILTLLGLPVEELRRRARTPFRLVPGIPALLDDFADSVLDEIRRQNRLGEPTRLILPVGPVAQYRRVVAVSNLERLSWKNVYTFNMDEFPDWQGRPVPLDHPLSFEGFMRREVFSALDPAIRIPAEQTFFPHPFRIDDISEAIRKAGCRNRHGRGDRPAGRNRSAVACTAGRESSGALGSVVERTSPEPSRIKTRQCFVTSRSPHRLSSWREYLEGELLTARGDRNAAEIEHGRRRGVTESPGPGTSRRCP